MHAKREEPSRPGWSGDRLDAAFPPEIEAPYFDEILDAWVLSRHADTRAAFRCPGLSPIGPRSKKRSEPPDERSRLKMREETLDALRPAQLQARRERLMVEIDSFVDGLPGDQPVDIVGMYARPLCLMLAAMVTDIDLSDAKRLDKKAQEVSAAAAEPYDPALNSGAKSANAELRSCFHSRAESLRESGFVALSQTLPCLLGTSVSAGMPPVAPTT